jgi:competence protein ComEC
VRLPIPPPLACAVLLGFLIALCGTSPRRVPVGATPDDRVDDRIAGVLGGPIVRTRHGLGAPLHADGTTVWIWTDAPIEPGLHVVATGRLRTPRGSLSPGEADRAAFVASRGAQWELTARHVEVLREDDALASRVWRWADRVQRTWAARIEGDDAAAAALRGIVTGDRAAVPVSLDDRWRTTGIYHVLSVSGLHLTVVAGLAFLLLVRLVAASPWGGRMRPARAAAPIAIVLACAYTLITGAQLATLRALIVVTIVLVAQMLDRPVRLVDSLGAAAIAILVWRPQDLYDASFQLSFVAALTLALQPRDPVVNDARLVRWIVRGFVTSAWVAITTAPITAYHFHHVAVGGVVGNLVLTPLLELVALPVGLAGVVLGDLGAPLVEGAVWVVRAVDALAKLLALGTPTGTIAVASPLVMAALVAIGVALAARARRTRVDLAGWLALCAIWALARTPPELAALRVTFLDVGQGDAALVELPSGAVWLVDAGGHASMRDVAAASAPGRTIARALAVYGHRAIDLAIISHPHPDHYLGLVALADTIPIRELWFADDTETGGTATFAQVTHALAARGTRLTRPSLGTLQVDGIELDVIAPRYRATEHASEVLAPDPVRSVNDNSLVVVIRYAGRSLLFTGDLEEEGEEQLVAAGLHPVDVVKVAHHGSKTSSTPAFVAATRPEIAVISCGVANQFGFPAAAVVERWREVGARVERTDVSGAITVTVSAAGALRVDRHAGP